MGASQGWNALQVDVWRPGTPGRSIARPPADRRSRPAAFSPAHAVRTLASCCCAALLAACGGAPTPPRPAMAPAASAYMTEALDVMQARSINRYRIAWPAFRAEAMARAAGAERPADTYEALRATVAALGDRHSSFRPPGGLAAVAPARWTGVPGVNGQLADSLMPPTLPGGRMLGARVAYVFLPAFAGPNPVGHADSIHAVVRALDARDPCGWVVDLRRNQGGNMWPMLAGLAPLLGDGGVGVFVDPDSVRQHWVMRGGAAGLAAGAPRTDTTMLVRLPGVVTVLRRASPPVAVLTGQLTASSGEAVAIAFRARPSTRSFGAPTFGVSTANVGIRLSDGAVLNLTVSTMGDRTGRLYGAAVPPDEAVAGPPAPVPGAGDAVMDAAAAWLHAQPACAR